MIKKMTYILIPACMSLSVAMAEPLPSNQLSSEQMDQVTAGAFNSSAIVGARATGSFLAVTGTTAVAQTASNGNAYAGVAGGGAVAAGAGNGAGTGTTVNPTTSQPVGSTSIQGSGRFVGSLVNVQGAVITTIAR